MRSNKLSAARSIAKSLRPSEDTIDTSIVRNAQLVISIVEGRLQSGVAAEVGHDAFMSASAGLAALAQARDHVITCHKQLTSVRDAQGLDEGFVGCTPKRAAQEQEQSEVAYLPAARSA
jgi:hypothetical protein